MAIGWDELGDLANLPDDRDLLKDRLAETYPDVTLGAIRVWAGVILRFRFEMKAGDHVICPDKADSTVNIGRIVGDFYVEPGVTCTGIYPDPAEGTRTVARRSGPHRAAD